MIDEQTIQKIGAMLADTAGPSRIILFGSHARGDAGDQSDLDLLVVKPVVNNRLREISRLRQVLRPMRVPVDLLVCSVPELNECGNLPSGAIYWALREGKTIHDSLG
ncbi:MAG: nucleotidyltransferase domain-containing protein [Magnetococcales bacterium]|nr:nucleotidyltransferase domain-containing protein [Magnetococcales bacterium]